jgi:hypothetical protein
VILKALCLLEEQLCQIIDERLKYPSAIAKLDLTCHQRICLAQSLFPGDTEPWLWNSLIELNKLRNVVARNVDAQGVNERIDDFLRSVPSGLVEATNAEDERFELALWTLFVAVADLASSSPAS